MTINVEGADNSSGHHHIGTNQHSPGHDCVRYHHCKSSCPSLIFYLILMLKLYVPSVWIMDNLKVLYFNNPMLLFKHTYIIIMAYFNMFVLYIGPNLGVLIVFNIIYSVYLLLIVLDSLIYTCLVKLIV